MLAEALPAQALPAEIALATPTFAETPRRTGSAAASHSLDDRVSSALEAHPHLRRRKLRIETHEGQVTLRGVVDTYFQKQMAQEALRQVEGVRQIRNHLEVAW